MVLNSATVTKPKQYAVKMNGKTIGLGRLSRVNLNAIKIDSAYQRDISRTWIAQHLPFDQQRAGAIVLSGRAGGPYCIDGGHRLELARESDAYEINAFVIDGLSQVDEARLFTQYQRERRNLTSHALYRADLVAQDSETLEMRRIVDNAGFRLAKTAGPDNITAIDSVRYIYRLGGSDLLARTLQCARDPWLGEEKALSGQILKGLAMFLRSANEDPAFIQAHFQAVIHRIAPTKLLRLSQAVAEKRKTVASSSASVAEALHQEYNKSLPRSGTPLGPMTISGRRRPKAYNK